MTDSVESEALFAMVPEWLLYSKASHTAIRVYAVLNRYANDVTGKAHPSHSTIAGHAGCSVATVRRAIEELETFGALRVRHRTIPGKKEATSNEYLLRVVDRRRGGGTDEQTPSDSPVVGPDSDGGPSTDDTTSPMQEGSLHGRADRPSTDEQTVPAPVSEEPEPVEPEPVEPVAPAARTRDLVFEAVCEVVGIDWTDPRVFNGDDRKGVNDAVAKIKGKFHETDPQEWRADEIRRRAANYATYFDTLTPHGLARHWTQCNTPNPTRSRRRPGDARRDRARERYRREMGEAS